MVYFCLNFTIMLFYASSVDFKQSTKPKLPKYIDETTGKSLEYRDLIKDPKLREIWAKSFANELGRLAQGIRDIIGTDTIHFI